MTNRFAYLLALAALQPALAQVTTYHYNNARTGATLNETALTTSNVNVNTFGKLFSLPVDGQIYAQPLYIPGVVIPQQGTHNVLYVATQNNSVYAYDADSGSQTPLWQVNLGPAMNYSTCCWFQDIRPQIGITSTPVIDLPSKTLYVVAESYENRVTYHRLHALDITTGADKVTPAAIGGSVPGRSYDSVNGVLTFNPIQQWQRPGLLLLNGNIYIGFGSHQDNTPYHGWLFAYSASTLQQTGILCFSPNGEENGIWQGGVAPAADASGNIYLETGNGPFDVNAGGTDYGDCIVKVSTSNGLRIVDYFAPSTQQSDQNNDWDLGSSGPVLMPGTNLGLAGGKDGKMYVFNTANLGQFNAAGDQLTQEWQATYSYSQQQAGGFWGGNYIFYNNTMYGFGERDSLKAFSFNGSQFNVSPSSQTAFEIASSISNDPAMAISANGTTPGTAIVWAAYSINGMADGGAYPGIFRAFDASDVSRELWNSNQNATRDSSANWAKWAPPTVANGKVYLPTFSNAVFVYGLLSGSGTSTSITATAGTPQSTKVNTAFTAALQATVKDASGNPVSGASVTFTAPGSGVSASFGGSNSATVSTNASGIATAPTLSANAQAGSYSVSASTAGATQNASFSLVNTAAAAGSITATAGTPQSANVGNAFSTALQATVKDTAGNPLSGVTVTFTAPASGASASFGGTATATASTNASGVATSPALTANSQAGSYNVTASVAGVSASASFALTNNASGSAGGALSGTGSFGSGNFNMTSEGSTDWVHWGIRYGGPGVTDRKGGVAAQISNYTLIGSLPIGTLNNDTRTLTWTDGTNTTSGSDNTALYVDSNSGHGGNGFSFTVPADTTTRSLTVHAGGQDSGATLTATLSDHSAANFQDAVTAQSGRYDRNYTITYRANSAGQTLTISWIDTTTTGNVTLAGASMSLAGLGNSIAANGGTPQSATVSTAFATPLQARVRDGNGNPLSGVSVTFTAPSGGPSASFGGSVTANATTNASGVATAPALTANAQTGSYLVTAATTGVTTNASFSLSNTAASSPGGATITATGGTSQRSNVNTAFATALQATVKDGNGNPLSGASVTFTAPASGASASFGGSATANATTNASGIATAPTLTANAQTGSYFVTATTAGVATNASFSLSNTSVSSSGGVLSATANSSSGTYNLTSEGSADWVHWGIRYGGPGVVDRKKGVTAQISAYTLLGSLPIGTINNDLRTLTWTDGMNSTTGSDNNALYVDNYSGHGSNGFSFTVPADTNTRNLVVHVGGQDGGGTLTASLSDSSAAIFQDTTPNQSGRYDRNYTITYRANSAGQTLTIKWIDATSSGHVILAGAALSLAVSGPGSNSISATGGSPQSATVNTPFATGLQATVKDGSGNPVTGVSVTFTAPSSGPSASFSGSATANAITNSSGIATAPALTANSQTGSYTLVAIITGAAPAVSFSLTNNARSSSGGALSGSGNSNAGTYNLTVEGPTDWVHWGDASLSRKTGVAAQISNYVVVGSGGVLSYTNDPRALSWTDGNPTASGSNNNGVYINSLQNGFSFTVPAGTAPHTLTVHVGGWLSGGTFTAHLSDGSAIDFLDSTTPSGGQYDRNYVLSYQAASSGQILTVTWVDTSGGGNVTLNGAALQ